MPLTPNVAAGALIQSAWGNQVRDRTVQRFATYAEILSGWPDAADGAYAVATDTGITYAFDGAAWYPLTPMLKTISVTITLTAGVMARRVVPYPEPFPSAWTDFAVIGSNCPAYTNNTPILISCDTALYNAVVVYARLYSGTPTGAGGVATVTVAGWPPGAKTAHPLWRYASTAVLLGDTLLPDDEPEAEPE